MRILRFDLRAFGPFTDVALDLSGGQQGLHLIYGPNEAGKSSALRALGQLFYGIPTNSSDNFLHPYPKLRIGAVLAGRDGRQIEVLRRKGAKNTLLCADDETPLDEAQLRALLGGCDQGQFDTMFGINHPLLVAGGQDIIRGQGEVGHVLFAAGAGIADLRSIRGKLENEAESLFKPGGSKPVINQALATLKEARKRVRETQLPSAEWLQHDKALREASDKLQKEIEPQLRDVLRQKARLERIEAALPVIAKRKQVLQRLAELGDTPLLAPDFAEKRRQAVTQLAIAENEEKESREAIQRLDAEIAAIVVPEDLLGHQPAIDALSDALGGYRQAQRDRPDRVAERAELEKNAAAILRQIRPDLSLDVADQLRLSTQQNARIRQLCRSHAGLAEKFDQSRAKVRGLEADLEGARNELAQATVPRDVRRLREAVQQAQSEGDLERRLADERSQSQAAAEQAALDLGKLGLWSGSLEELERLQVPAAETVDRWEREFGGIDQEIGRLEAELHTARRELTTVDGQIEQLRLMGSAPTEDEVMEARRLRDVGWQLVLQAWRQGKLEEGPLQAFLARFPETGELAAAYEHAVAAADELADRLRREADRVAQRAGLQVRRLAAGEQIAQVERTLGEARDRRQAAQGQWEQAWAPLGITPLSPREMAGWLRRQQDLAQAVSALRAGRAAILLGEERIEASRAALRRSLAEYGEPAADREPLAGLLRRGQAAVERAAASATAHQQCVKNIARLERGLAAATATAEAVETERRDWKDQWAAVIETLGLPSDTPPDVAEEVVDRIKDLLKELDKITDKNQRIAEIDRFAERFSQTVRELALEAVPALAPLPAEDAAEQMIAGLQKSRADRKILEGLKARQAKETQRLDNACATIRKTAFLLQSLCLEAHCERPEALPQVEEASREVAALRKERDSRDEELLRLSAAMPVEAFIHDATGLNPDELPSHIAELDQRGRDMDSAKESLLKTVGEERGILATMTPGADAANAAEEVQNVLAGIQPNVQQYLCLRLASAVLRESIERYRKKNEGPVLARASELFCRLTLGSFVGLRIDFDERGEQVLAGVRASGDALLPAAMSDGTSDQLYLALRLASLETWLQRNEPIPFVVDDILISFDNQRAVATLEVLGELSRLTQMIFFTHHAHLVELARQCVDADILFVHHLGGR